MILEHLFSKATKEVLEIINESLRDPSLIEDYRRRLLKTKEELQQPKTAGESSGTVNVNIDREKLNNSIGRGGYLQDDLKVFCRQLGLPISGTKAVLVERIKKHLGWE